MAAAVTKSLPNLKTSTAEKRVSAMEACIHAASKATNEKKAVAVREVAAPAPRWRRKSGLLCRRYADKKMTGFPKHKNHNKCPPHEALRNFLTEK